MSNYIFNPKDWEKSTLTDEMLEEIRDELDPDFINADGDTMTGALVCSTISANQAIYTPALDIGTQLSFPDNSIQTKAFTDQNKTDIDLIKDKTQYMSIENSKTKLTSDLVFNDNTIQTTGFTSTIRSNLQNITYDSGQLKTTIGNNCLINNLTCNNINTSHLTSTISNLQQQITDLSTSIGNIQTNASAPTGSIMMFGATSSLLPPVGWLVCQGQLISRTTYADLYAIIGNVYLYDKPSVTGMFYLPDLRGMFVRGAGTGMFSVISGLAVGSFQEQSVQSHSHLYRKPNDDISVVTSVNVTGGIGIDTSTNKSSVWDNKTDEVATTNPINDPVYAENRPINISLNYIIKF